jgi:hypothetical protein
MLHFGRIGKVAAPAARGVYNALQWPILRERFLRRFRCASNSARIEFVAHRIRRASNFEIAK